MDLKIGLLPGWQRLALFLGIGAGTPPPDLDKTVLSIPIGWLGPKLEVIVDTVAVASATSKFGSTVPAGEVWEILNMHVILITGTWTADALLLAIPRLTDPSTLDTALITFTTSAGVTVATQPNIPPAKLWLGPGGRPGFRAYSYSVTGNAQLVTLIRRWTTPSG